MRNELGLTPIDRSQRRKMYIYRVKIPTVVESKVETQRRLMELMPDLEPSEESKESEEPEAKEPKEPKSTKETENKINPQNQHTKR